MSHTSDSGVPLPGLAGGGMIGMIEFAAGAGAGTTAAPPPPPPPDPAPPEGA